jgi:hypothetical protein
MTTRKLVLMFVAWLFAAGAIAITAAVVMTEILTLIRVVDRSEPSYGLSLNLLTGITFVALASVPFVFRKRFASDDVGGSGRGDAAEDGA